jgi:hypothetical protein
MHRTEKSKSTQLPAALAPDQLAQVAGGAKAKPRQVMGRAKPRQKASKATSSKATSLSETLQSRIK